MANEVIVDDLQIQEALINGIADNKGLKIATIRFIDDAADTWRMVWDASEQGVLAQETGEKHPYQTYEYREHIKKLPAERIDEKFIREALISGALLGGVYNDSDVAGFVEEGTNPDKEGSRSPWGPNTPTPAFECAKRTAEIMNAGGHDY